jgi:hypothetical protein
MSQSPLQPSDLPDIESLRRRLRSVAMLDAIVMPDWEFRYYSYDAHWGAGQAMASMRNGSGDGFHALFTSGGAIVKGIDRDLGFCAGSPYEGLPAELKAFADEPAFEPATATFCIWRRRTDDAWSWSRVNSRVRLDLLLVPVRGAPAYLGWATAYYGKAIAPGIVELVFSDAPLSAEILKSFAPDCDIDAVFKDAREIGYPILEASAPAKKKPAPPKVNATKKSRKS